MASQPQLELSFTEHKVQRSRESKRAKIEEFFAANLWKKFDSAWLHQQYGPSFRTRVSEIRRDPDSKITIKNEYEWSDLAKAEVSCYWAERKQ